MFFKKTNRIAELEQQVSEMKGLMSPEMNDILSINEKLKNLKADLKSFEDTSETQKRQLNKEIQKLEDNRNSLSAEIEKLKKDIIETNDEILYQTCGLYEPKFIFANAEAYKVQLKLIRDQQKMLIKNDGAATGNMQWTVNGNASQGKKMVKDMQKLLLRAFNSECDELVDKVKCNNYDSYVNRMSKSCETISKLGVIMNISITPQYLDLKLSELALALDYQQKKQQEKEAQRAERERLREEAALRKEIEAARKKIDKEKAHYLQALNSLNAQINNADNSEKEALETKRKELEMQLNDIEKSIKDIDYREANQRAGYVYIISNIGAFGENIYKIGMTRRLEPMDRIYELGDASVPFRFDTHAMIFSDDAPALEAALHRAFEDRKVNMINHRREFFRVTLDEIKEVVKSNFDKTVEFIDFPEAEEYRLSRKMYVG